MKLGFFIYRFLKKSEKAKEWLKSQSHPEDALLYLIEKEIYENGIRDLSYVIPRIRSDEHFAALTGPNHQSRLQLESISTPNDGLYGDYIPEGYELPLRQQKAKKYRVLKE